MTPQEEFEKKKLNWPKVAYKENKTQEFNKNQQKKIERNIEQSKQKNTYQTNNIKNQNS